RASLPLCLRAFCASDLPDHGHAARDTPQVAVADLPAGGVDRHLRHPPRGPAQRCPAPTEGPRRGHLDDSAAARAALEKPHPAVVGQNRGPLFDVTGDLKHVRQRSPDGDAITGTHGETLSVIRYPLAVFRNG